jgi:hypothetical protein
MEKLLEDLCQCCPAALGAAVCDSEGESLALALGSADFPSSSLQLIDARLPRQFDRQSWPENDTKLFTLRQWAAEPSRSTGRLRQAWKSGAEHACLTAFCLRFRHIDLAMATLEDHMYLVLVLRRPNLLSLSRREVMRTAHALEHHLAQNT